MSWRWGLGVLRWDLGFWGPEAGSAVLGGPGAGSGFWRVLGFSGTGFGLREGMVQGLVGYGIGSCLVWWRRVWSGRMGAGKSSPITNVFPAVQVVPQPDFRCVVQISVGDQLRYRQRTRRVGFGRVWQGPLLLSCSSTAPESGHKQSKRVCPPRTWP